ncbi:MAG: RNA methyltransferase [Acidobacteria bacterium]|nr:RNA methyltransferase [Acidobacteriota bacterium]
MPAHSFQKLIEGRHHPLVKMLRRMVRTQELLSDGLVLLETVRLIEDARSSGAAIRRVFVSIDSMARYQGLLQKLPAETEFFQLAPKVFDTLVTTQTSQGILALADEPHWATEDLFASMPLILVLAGIQDPGNLGTILRTAEAFAATGVVLTPGTVSPYNAKALRATAGALFRLPLLRGLTTVEALSLLQQYQVRIFASVAKEGKPLPEVNFAEPTAVVLGSEGQGLPEEWRRAAEPLTIPMAPAVESLNVAAAAAVILYEITRQRAIRKPINFAG